MQETERAAAADQRAGYVITHRDELERTGSWSLVRRSLDCKAFGLNLVEIPAGQSIPEHDETGRDQEEVFFVISGSPTLVIDGEDHAAPAGTFARIDPEHRRTVRNDVEVVACADPVEQPFMLGRHQLAVASEQTGRPDVDDRVVERSRP
ncbi:MAG TPA: cupin domain-containing protein, partial [Solirubrobacteraceae bacterium]|nr:cupin domain-containing protein [Solirubrobacteraceae bacterium]